MGLPASRMAHKVYYQVLDRAVDSETGIRIRFDAEGEALQYRLRLHWARKLDRELNCTSRSPDDPNYGRSDYDDLIVRVLQEDGAWWIYIERLPMPTVIEEL